MPMAEEGVRSALTVLDAVLEAPTSARRDLLDQHCGNDSALRREVESLLAFESDAEEFLHTPAGLGVAALDPLSLTSKPLEPGVRFGPYEIREVIGRGGMGAVYRARRRQDYDAEVAIKLMQGSRVHPTGFGGEVLQRFQRERQILARLEHPSIARLLDGGTDNDQPYLVMEYIDGEPIDGYCERRRSTVRQRLELFLGVCDAVAFAHRNLVVHRDLKPSNILVTAEGVPKLLDFGIAKLLDDPGLGESIAVTGEGGTPMTPRYASPEQIQGQPITTASDIYSLGVLLYELLTGGLPNDLEACPPAQIPQRICVDEPLRPSTAVVRDHPTDAAIHASKRTPGGVSSARGDDPRGLRRQLAGDIDAIVLRALRKQPEQRYASAEALAADIRRHLEGLPVLAREGTWTYLTHRFIRRHRAWLAVAAGLLLALGAFAIQERWQLEREQRRSQRLEAVLEELILTADPDTGPFDPGKLLGRAEEQISALDEEPRLRGELLDSLGWIHRKLGNAEKARHLVTESLDSWRRLEPGDDPDLALRINNVGVLLSEQGDAEGAEGYFREALAMRERLGQGSKSIVTNLGNLASALLVQGKWDEAEACYRRSLEIRRQAFGPDDPQVASSLRSLGALFFARGDFERAEPLLRQALDLRQRAYGEEHTAVASVLDLLAQVRHARGDLDEAEALVVRALDIRRRLLGDNHRDVGWSELHHGNQLLDHGALATARILIVRGYSKILAADSRGHWRQARAETILAKLLQAEGATAEAIPCLEAAHETLHRQRSAEATYTREARRLLERLEKGVVSGSH